MPDARLLYSIEDAHSILSYAIGSGLSVAIDEPSVEPKLSFLTKIDDGTNFKGVFNIFHPDWIFGELQFMEISGGYYRGKYFFSPRVNWTSISCYFGGERIEGKQRRLGSGDISFRPDWLEKPAMIIRKAPSDMAVWYKALLKLVDTGKKIRGANMAYSYKLCKGAINAQKTENCLPPFDFIPWPPECQENLLHKPKKQSEKFKKNHRVS